MNKNFVISLGREYGSGGYEIGIRLSELLSITCYDKKLVLEAALLSGLSDEYISEADERIPGRLYYAFSLGYGPNSGSSGEHVFNVQSDTIKTLSDRESCIIIGRCADYVLRKHPLCISLFVHAPEQIRIERIATRQKISEKDAAEMIRKIDKARADYYNFYTNKQWGRTVSYNLSIDSSILGVEDTAKFICDFIEKAII